MSLHRLNLRPLLAVAALILVAGCVAEEPARSGRPGASAFAAGTYRCNDGSALDIRRVSGGVQVTEPDGDVTVLPPAPPNQSNRFGRQGFALVLEGRTALFMKAGAVPLDCEVGRPAPRNASND
ncbi:MAG TPA: hypothetical protein VNS02_02110 [Rhizobiaceae bacterium]|nr:hypothetical protein [Rhizobiaceae bacterium]